MNYKSMISIGLLCSLAGIGMANAHDYDLTNPNDQKKLGISFMNNFNEAKPIIPIPIDALTEENAYKIADYYVEEQLKTRGTIAGYKVGTFAKGEYDNGPVDGLSGPVTAVMFSNGIHESGKHISVD